MITALVTVVNGSAYEKFTQELFASAREFFRPTKDVQLIELEGSAGWPDATMYRYHHLVKHMPNANYVFMSDADMVFESKVGPEILPVNGISAALHPGYVETPASWLPYELRPQSSCCVLPHQMSRYYAGGFVGGTRQHMLNLARDIASLIDTDAEKEITPIWHDESALNKRLSQKPPFLALSPSYCYPDNDSYYKTLWKENYTRKLVALDKTEEVRGER